MNTQIRIRSVLLFLGLPALWFGSFSFSEQISVADLSSPSFEFVPVTVHASHFADYSTDAFTNSFAPVDEDIVTDAQADQGITPPVLPIQPAVQEPNPGNGSDDSQDEDGDVQSTDPGQGQSQTGDNGNKDKDADSPGNSGTDHGGGSGNGNGGGNGKNK